MAEPPDDTLSPCAHGKYSEYPASTLVPRPDYSAQAEMADGVDLRCPDCRPQ